MRRKYSSKDFTKDLLPHTRRDQLFDIFKTRKSIIFNICVSFLLGSTLLIILFGFKYLGILPTALSSYKDDPDAMLAFIKINNIVFDAFYIVGMLLLGLVISGNALIIKKLCWGENINYWKDFKLSLKQNSKHFLLTTFFISILRFAVNTFANLIGNIFLMYIPYAFFVLILPIFLMSLSISTIYQGKLFENFSNGLAYSFKKAPITLVFLIFPIICKATNYIVNDYFSYPIIGGALFVIFLVILLPLYILCWYLYSLSLFDEYTNKKYYPEYYHKGLADSHEIKRIRKNNFLLKK